VSTAPFGILPEPVDGSATFVLRLAERLDHVVRERLREDAGGVADAADVRGGAVAGDHLRVEPLLEVVAELTVR
jgi:hypothetical protein